MKPSRLTIGRLTSRYVVARDHPDPAALTDRLNAAALALPRHLAAVLAPLAADAPDTVWLLRSIEVELTLNAGVDADIMATAWARVVARNLFARLNGDTSGLVCFADRAAYLASFLRDLAEGDAWSLWYYQPFDGLRALPIAAALRTALLADPAEGRRALLLQEPWQAVRVLSALGANEAARVLTGLDVPTSQSAPGTLAEATLPAWRQAASFGLCPNRLALGCWLAIIRQAPGSVGQGAKNLAWALAALRLLMVDGIAEDVTQSIGNGDLPRLYRAVGPTDAERLAPLLALPQSVRQALAEPSCGDDIASENTVRDTPFGGLFLLLPHLSAAPSLALDEAACGPNLPLFLVLSACAGDNAAHAVFLDPVWRDLFGVPPQFLLADLAAWSRGLPGPAETAPLARFAAESAAVLSSFARTLPGFAASSPEYLCRNFLNGRARVTFAADVIEVELARPPLDLVLGIAGLMRERLELPWLDPRPILLRPLERAADR